jgi:hypothetical protein
MYSTRVDKDKAQFSNETLRGDIDKTNTKNQTDIINYPLQQRYITDQERERVQHIIAQQKQALASAFAERMRGGLYGAETNQTNAKTDQIRNPLYNYDYLKKRYESLPAGQEKISFGKVLDSMFGGGGLPGGATTKGSHSGNGNVLQSRGGNSQAENLSETLGLTVNPFTVSKQSMKGGEYIGKDASGNPVVYTSPTQPTQTGLQNREMAAVELKQLDPIINAGISPYTSAWGSHLTYADDLYMSKKGDKAAQERIIGAEGAMQMIAEKAILRLRQASPGVQIGQEAINDQIKRMYPSLPPQFLRKLNSAENIAEATKRVDAKLSQATQAAAQMTAQNFPTSVNGLPAWAQQQNSPPGYFELQALQEMGFEPQAQPQQIAPNSQQNQPQYSPEQLSSMAQEAIARGADPAQVNARIAQLQGGG